MKSTSYPINMAGDNAGFTGTPSSSLGVVGTDGYLANGFNTVFKLQNISMGEMRGFEYPQNGDSIWPSSTGLGDGTERLHNTLAIGVGVPVGGGSGGA